MKHKSLTPQEVLGRIFDLKDEDTVVLLGACALLENFNQDRLRKLLGELLLNDEIYEKLTKSTFVRPHPLGGYKLHGSVRIQSISNLRDKYPRTFDKIESSILQHDFDLTEVPATGIERDPKRENARQITYREWLRVTRLQNPEKGAQEFAKQIEFFLKKYQISSAEWLVQLWAEDRSLFENQQFVDALGETWSVKLAVMNGDKKKLYDFVTQQSKNRPKQRSTRINYLEELLRITSLTIALENLGYNDKALSLFSTYVNLNSFVEENEETLLAKTLLNHCADIRQYSRIKSLTAMGLNMPDVEDWRFKSNKKQLDFLKAVCKRDTNPLIMVSGAGGVGKTSLVMKCTNQLIEDNSVDTVIWKTFKEKLLIHDKVITFNADSNLRNASWLIVNNNKKVTYETIFQQFSQLIGEISFLSENLPDVGNYRKQRVIIVLDGFDESSSKSAEHIIKLIRSLPSGFNVKVIITSRNEIPVPNSISISCLTPTKKQLKQSLKVELGSNANNAEDEFERELDVAIDGFHNNPLLSRLYKRLYYTEISRIARTAIKSVMRLATEYTDQVPDLDPKLAQILAQLENELSGLTKPSLTQSPHKPITINRTESS